MEIDACRHSGVIKALTSAVRSPATTPEAQRGYTLVELLVGVALGAIVLSSLGGALMVSEVKTSANIQRNLDAKDAANRTTDLMRREATFSSFIAAGSSFLSAGASPLDNCVNATRIRFPQRNNASDICYKTVAPADLPAVYQAAYQGPCVLVRIGPPYKPNGDLDTSASASPIAQVLLDGIATTSTSCTPASGFSVVLGQTLIQNTPANPVLTTAINRNADLTIRMASGASYGFSLRAPNNPAYDGNALFSTCTITTDAILGCARLPNQVTHHYKPVMDSLTESIEGQPNKENLFYFPHPRAEYALSQDSSSSSESCKYNRCYVSRNGVAVQLSKVDTLIFSDQEIRPGS